MNGDDMAMVVTLSILLGCIVVGLVVCFFQRKRQER